MKVQCYKRFYVQYLCWEDVQTENYNRLLIAGLELRPLLFLAPRMYSSYCVLNIAYEIV